MRSIIAAALALFATFSAHAEGPYSGIWQAPGNVFMFVNQNGNSFIVTSLSNLPSSGVQITLANGQRIVPTSIDVGDLVSGTATNNVATISGVTAFRMCNITARMNLNTTSSITMEYLGMTNTDLGTSQGVNCASLFQAAFGSATTAQFTKIF